MDDRAVLEQDGTCWYFDIFDEARVAWPSLAAWAAQLLEEWSSEDFGHASEFADAITRQPTAWVVDALVALSEVATGDQLALVGAGPLETLVSHSGHGALTLEAVDKAARQEPSFRRALSNVWLSEGVPDHVRHRLAELGARDFVAEHAMSPKEFEAYIARRDARELGWG